MVKDYTGKEINKGDAVIIAVVNDEMHIELRDGKIDGIYKMDNEVIAVAVKERIEGSYTIFWGKDTNNYTIQNLAVVNPL